MLSSSALWKLTGKILVHKLSLISQRKRLEEARLKKESEERKLQEAEEKKELVKRRLTETRERKISARNNLSVEPENGIRLQFKLPNGAKFIRKFVEDAPISDIFCKHLSLMLYNGI